jgi:fructose-bisphosphate aldolase class II
MKFSKLSHGKRPIVVFFSITTETPSRGARKYANDRFLYHLMIAATEIYPDIPVALHLDHGNNLETCRTAIELGFTSVMIDGSLLEDGETPADFEYNVRVTREVVEMAHPLGVSVEGEIGCLGGIENGHGADIDASHFLTDPGQAEKFVERTGVDALAVAVGTSHGAYKFTRPPTKEVLMMDLIEEIHRRLPNTHLVMHGSSSVPQELLDIIRMYGGYMKETYGVPVEEIQRGIEHGVRKINVDTDLRLAATAAIRKVFCCEPTEIDPRKYLGPARDAMKEVVITRMKAFGQAGHAGDYDSISLSEMAKRYV